MSQGFEIESVDANTSIPTLSKPIQVPEIGSIQQTLVEHFTDIKDPRVERTKKHQLTDILVIAILAVIAGVQGWEDIENYGINKQKWLEEFLALNVLKKHIIARKSLKFGRCQFLPLVNFTNHDSGQDSKTLSWLFDCVIFGTRLLVKFSFI